MHLALEAENVSKGLLLWPTSRPMALRGKGENLEHAGGRSGSIPGREEDRAGHAPQGGHCPPRPCNTAVPLPLLPVPGQPMNFRAEAKSETSIGLSWSPPRLESIIKYELLFREGDHGREVPGLGGWAGLGGSVGGAPRDGGRGVVAGRWVREGLGKGCGRGLRGAVGGAMVVGGAVGVAYGKQELEG